MQQDQPKSPVTASTKLGDNHTMTLKSEFRQPQQLYNQIFTTIPHDQTPRSPQTAPFRGSTDAGERCRRNEEARSFGPTVQNVQMQTFSAEN